MRRRRAFFSAEDAAFLIHVASLVAQAIENARLYEHTRRSLRELEHLSRLGSAIARAEVDRRAARIGCRGRACTLVRAESLASTWSSRAATGCACAPPRRRAGRPRHRLPARAERRARTRTQASGGTLTSVLAGTLWGAADDALGARRAARRRRRGAGLPRRAPGRRTPRQRARARPRQLARVPDARSGSSACSSSTGSPSATASRTCSTTLAAGRSTAAIAGAGTSPRHRSPRRPHRGRLGAARDGPGAEAQR